MPEDEAVPPALTARQLVRYTAALTIHGVQDRDMPDRCLGTVGLLEPLPTARWAASARACANGPR